MSRVHPMICDAERQAAQICRRFQIRNTHDGVMLWRFTGEWRWFRPYSTRDAAEDYLFGKLPAIESEM